VSDAPGPVVSSMTEEAQGVLARLRGAHLNEVPGLALLNAHYCGEQPLSYMAPELIMELGDRLRQVVVHWPGLAIDSTEERLDVEGFRLGGKAEAADDLWGIWQANGLDLSSHQAQVDALVMRRSYLIVGTRTGDDIDPSSGVDIDVPLISVESPLEVFAARDPRTRRTASAAKWWSAPGPKGEDENHVTLYQRNSTSWWVERRSDVTGRTGWVLDEDGSKGVDEHKLGVVPVVPLVNRPRTSAKPGAVEGTSDLAAVIPLSDAACKIATDMMVGAEFHALPRRWATGVDAASFVDQGGNPVSALSRVAGRLWADESGDVKFGQFSEANLSNFHETMNLLAHMVAGIAGLPPHYLGLATDNPASADAIRSGEARLVKRAERRQRTFGEAYEQVMRIALLFRDGRLPSGASRMETLWRDASTPTIAQAADAAVKKFAGGIVPLRQTREDLGYSSIQIQRMEQADSDAAAAAARAFGVGGEDPQMPGETSPAPEPVSEVAA
jgi:hypothetical protein